MKCCITVILFLTLIPASGFAGEAEVVVGGLLKAEGGEFDLKNSSLTSPFGVDFGPAGEMWIVELEGGRVHRLEPSGQLIHAGGDGTVGYSGDGQLLRLATFNGMHNCAVTPNGDLYIADSWNHCVRKVDHQSGVISTIAGTGKKGSDGDGGPATSATFDFVMCITLSPAGDRLHIADLNNRRIRVVDLRTGMVSTVAGNGLKGVPSDGAKAVESPLVDPRAVAEDSEGNLWILERGGHALRVVRPDGTIQSVAGNGKAGYRDDRGVMAQFGSPKHLCLDDRGKLYIADDQNAAIRRFDPQTGEVTSVLGRGHGDPRIQLRNPHGVTWENGWLYVVDMGHNRILRIQPEDR